MKFWLLVVMFFAIAHQEAFVPVWSRKTRARVTFNVQQLRAMQAYIAQHPAARVVVVSDLHDVAFKRKSGDFSRFWDLPIRIKGHFLKRIIPFGLRYLWYKLKFSAKKPHIELSVLRGLSCNDRNVLLPLLNPFTLDAAMFGWYKRCAFPLIGFSNIGPASLRFMQQLYPAQMRVFSAIQCTGPEVQYRQKHERKRYQDLIHLIKKNLEYAPNAIFFIDDKRPALDLCRQVLRQEHIASFVYHFHNAINFIRDVRTYAPAIVN